VICLKGKFAQLDSAIIAAGLFDCMPGLSAPKDGRYGD
jgi:hypothetical protein